jgi:Flp pilus assembly protein TadD
MSTGVELLRRGNAFAGRGELAQAIACFRTALVVEPDWPEALSNLGNALRELGDFEQAVAYLEQALRRRPEFPEALLNLGVALEEQGDLEDAGQRLRQAIRLRPGMAHAHSNLASLLHKQGRDEEALECLHEALRTDPNFAEAHHNLGVVLDSMGRPQDAIASYREALRRRPDYPDAHLDLGLALLATGDFPAGWEEYEWRWRTRRSPRRHFLQPEWDGSALDGRVLLVHAEQGLGDTVQFLRYVPLVRDAAIVLEVPSQLAPLAEGLPGVTAVVRAGSPLPHFDRHIPLLSLPRLFRTTVDAIPGRTPYLQPPDPARVVWWNRRMGCTAAFRIGLVWAGGAANSRNRTRSMHLADWAPLAAIPDISFFSLQKGAAAQELAPAGLAITNVLEATGDIRDTAAVIQNLDLVLSVDTLVAHLAGALAKPVWTLLSFAADWRWLRQREDCPWYPTMRLFRQNRAGDWQSALARVTDCLRETYLCHPSSPCHPSKP